MGLMIGNIYCCVIFTTIFCFQRIEFQEIRVNFSHNLFRPNPTTNIRTTILFVEIYEDIDGCFEKILIDFVLGKIELKMEGITSVGI